ncbi:ABC transporter ATP-binding protein [Streptomyces iconiensis]|uniref:ATP-binding cassette domain-containing protein n=1 Tax=Streptomyces iconiensis TaxID=1384038 RepID=A0ABT6ZRZ8_9ACTN|nr:ATP-binding cassette domain-containing protein [Streptomyces iconiensis]MDJ1131559.1 ATP-binding cassette domain-containing protein [Streptomyces iconiensis]
MGRRTERRTRRRAGRAERSTPRGPYDAMGFPLDAGEPATVRLEGVRKVYGEGDAAVTALDGVTAHFAPGTFTAVMGLSGSGKSTFLRCAAGLDRASAGTVSLEGRDLGAMNETALTKLRRDRVGFLSERFTLPPALTVERITERITERTTAQDPDRNAERGADRNVERAGLTARVWHLPVQLLGGRQPTGASAAGGGGAGADLARALAARPAVLFADEPTGTLDTRAGAELLALLRQAVDEEGQTVIIATREPDAASCADRVLFLVDGRIADEMKAPTSEKIADRMTRPWHPAPHAGPRRGGSGRKGQAGQGGEGVQDAAGRAVA